MIIPRNSLGKLGVIVGVEHAKTSRHQCHHVKMVDLDIWKIKCGVGAQRFCGAVVSRASKRSVTGFAVNR